MHAEAPALTDAEFDALLAPAWQAASARFWTPAHVATRVALWLAGAGVTRVVDVGAGLGKFCIVAARAAPQLAFVGLEQRPHLVGVARTLAQRFGVAPRVSFLTVALRDVPLPAADAYYVFNPFGEALATSDQHLDATVVLGAARFADDVAHFERCLDAMAVGTYVAIYNGFGGRMPPSFARVAEDASGPLVLAFWQKTARRVSPPHPRRRDPQHTEFVVDE